MGIQKLNNDDDDVATTSLKVSVTCPLGKMRMKVPCRPKTCSHLQCFDATLFLQMNERKPKWNCPVCSQKALYDDLLVDGYYQEILDSKETIDNENFEFLKDGKWRASKTEEDNNDIITNTTVTEPKNHSAAQVEKIENNDNWPGIFNEGQSQFHTSSPVEFINIDLPDIDTIPLPGSSNIPPLPPHSPISENNPPLPQSSDDPQPPQEAEIICIDID